MSAHVVKADQHTFDATINQPGSTYIVDFWASWCMPCRMVEPVLDEIAQEQPDRITLVKVNVDENPDIAARYGVMSIPTLVRIENGQEVSRAIGALPKAQLVRRLGL